MPSAMVTKTGLASTVSTKEAPRWFVRFDRGHMTDSPIVPGP